MNPYATEVLMRQRHAALEREADRDALVSLAKSAPEPTRPDAGRSLPRSVVRPVIRLGTTVLDAVAGARRGPGPTAEEA